MGLGNNYYDFQDLNIWKRGREIRLRIEEIVKHLPKDEKYRLGDQMVRASRSITALIAEGYGRYHFKENIQFCRQARGSLDETKDHLITSRDLHEAPIERCNGLIEKCNLLKKVLNGYIRSLKNTKYHQLITNNQ